VNYLETEVDGDAGVPLNEATFSIYAKNAAGDILLTQHFRGSIKPDGLSNDDIVADDVGGFVVTMPWRDGIASVSKLIEIGVCIHHNKQLVGTCSKKKQDRRWNNSTTKQYLFVVVNQLFFSYNQFYYYIVPVKRQTQEPILLDTLNRGKACPITASVDKVAQNATDLLITYSYALVDRSLVRDASEDGSDDSAPLSDPLALFGKQHRVIVEYTPDGVVWQPLHTIELLKSSGTAEQAVVSLNELEGPTTEARVRLSPVGGLAATIEPCFSDESSMFTVGNRMPTAYIVWPTEGSTISLTSTQVKVFVWLLYTMNLNPLLYR
jgi:hypothetical protein